MTNEKQAPDGLTLQLTILLSQGSTDREAITPTWGLSSQPSSSDKATKAEANYRPAYLDPDNQSEVYARTGGASLRARGRMDEMEIPKGAPSEEGPGEGVGTVWRKECGTCVHFHASSCEIVAGIIDHEYVCDWWEE